ncbi:MULTISPECIES: hypothetical protein [unclassified Methanosarcina]|nr:MULTISPECIES: hypothetical protein [unclassified Methanosarcina]
MAGRARQEHRGAIQKQVKYQNILRVTVLRGIPSGSITMFVWYVAVM